MNSSSGRREIYLRLVVGYIGVALLILVSLAFSLLLGTGWKPIIAGSPVFLTFFIAVSYQFVKDIRTLGRRERGKSEPQRRKGPWEDES